MKLIMMSAVLVLLLVLASVSSTIASLAMAQEDEERENVIEMAEVKLITCESTVERVATGLTFWQQKQCDHDILFLKGLCEASNNTAYAWCYSSDLERYLNDRGLQNAPRPPDTWCNIDIDGCIELNKQAKAGFEEIGNPDSEATQNLVEYFDNKIQELEGMKQEDD